MSVESYANIEASTNYAWYGFSSNSIEDAYIEGSNYTPDVGYDLTFASSAIYLGMSFDEDENIEYFYVDAIKNTVRYSWSPTYSYTTNFDSTSDLYAYVEPGSIFYNSIFDAQGDYVSTNYFKASSATFYAGSSSAGSFILQTTPASIIPPNYSALADDGDVQGWYFLSTCIAINDFCGNSLTNGFKYK
jgi:hypothetical protein